MKQLLVLALACLLSIKATQPLQTLMVSDQISGPDYTASLIDDNPSNSSVTVTVTSTNTSALTADPSNSTDSATNSTSDSTNSTADTTNSTNGTNSTSATNSTSNSTVDPTNSTTNSTTDNSTTTSNSTQPSDSNSTANSTTSDNSSSSSNSSTNGSNQTVPSGSNSSSGGDVTPVNPSNYTFYVNFSGPASSSVEDTGTGVVFDVNPEIFSDLSVFNVSATCTNYNQKSGCSNVVLTNQLQQLNFTDDNTLFNLTQCSNSTNGQLICQNTTGVWSFDSSRHLKKIVDFASVGQKVLPTACQALFPEVYTQYMTSICTINGVTYAYAYDQTGSNKLSLQLLDYEITQFDYIGGFYFAFTQTNVSLGSLQFAEKSNQNLEIMSQNVTGCSNFAAVNISVGNTSSNYINPTLGFFYLNNSIVNQFNTSEIINDDGTTTTINSTNITGQWELALFLLKVEGGATTNPTSGIRRVLSQAPMTITNITAQSGVIPINFTAILNTTNVTKRFAILNPNANLSVQVGVFVPQQLIQSGLAFSTTANNIATFSFPFVAVWENNVVGISMTISSLYVASEVVECYYATPNNNQTWVAQPKVSAYKNIVVVPFTYGNQVSYALYQSDNSLTGGNPGFSCGNNNTLNVSSTYLDTSNGAIVPPTILPVGSIVGVNGSNYLFELQVNPYYGFYVKSESKETNVTVIIQDFDGNSTALFTFNTTSTLNYEYTRPGFVGLYFGLIIAGLVILLGTLGFLCIQSTEKARMQALLS